MEELRNPYQPAASVSDAELIPFFSGPLEWGGHRFLISAKQIPLSLWLVASVVVAVDENQIERFIKWRWHKSANWTFQHTGSQCVGTLQCTGANQIHCRLIVDGIPVGESLIPAKGFWFGLVTVVIVTAAVLWVVVRVSRTQS